MRAHEIFRSKAGRACDPAFWPGCAARVGRKRSATAPLRLLRGAGSTGWRVVGRIAPDWVSGSPSRVLTRVDLPAPVEPPTTMVRGCRRALGRCSRRVGVPWRQYGARGGGAVLGSAVVGDGVGSAGVSPAYRRAGGDSVSSSRRAALSCTSVVVTALLSHKCTCFMPCGRCGGRVTATGCLGLMLSVFDRCLD